MRYKVRSMTARGCRLRALSVAAAAAVVGACGGDEGETQPTIRPVRVQQVFATGGSRERMFSGAARAGVESRFSFRVAGTLERLAVAVGDAVRAGQVIAELDPRDYQLQFQQAEASLRQAQAEERNALASYDRVRLLYENNNATARDLDAARAGFESATAAVQSLENRVELARLQLGYTRLTAPLAGSIASVDVEVNENVRAGQEIVFMTSGSVPEVTVAVPGVLIAQIEEGAPPWSRLTRSLGARFPRELPKWAWLRRVWARPSP